MADTAVDKARRLVLTMLSDVQSPTPEIIRHKVRLVITMLRADTPGFHVDEDELVRDVESRCNVWVPAAATLDDPHGHMDWLPAKQAQINWRFWERYRLYLEASEQLPPESIRRLDDITDQALRRLEDPQRPGRWDRRGLVAGQVQSGKTSNYIGLLCKAIDAGYRLIIVLAGRHNSLRSQTQLRLDQGIIGWDSQKRNQFERSDVLLGVGRLNAGLWPVIPLTTSADSGDFKLAVARQLAWSGGADPVVLVVKKNASILGNLIKWATLVLQQPDPETGRKVVRDVPLLVIDDEADDASINTNSIPVDENGHAIEDLDPTRINGLIRKLLSSFEKTIYVGYTATPFANIFIPDVVNGGRFGDDLFPRSFIINLPVPSNYIGPAQVFGLAADEETGLQEQQGLPILRRVTDYESWIPDRHKKDHEPGALPDSLREAIRSFILVIAARMARQEEQVHNSMLIHATRFTNVQKIVAEQVAEELDYVKQRLRYGDGASRSQLLGELRQLWERDFVRTSDQFNDAALKFVSWMEVQSCVNRSASRIEIRRINGTAKDALEYFEHPDGLSVIAIGGDKLSRGLTLEGLSISYFLRASRMYDTLMQMGRWFGYRPGYIDLCRLYTTPELIDWYRDITLASEELRQQFDYMADIGGTPQDFGLKVRTHPDGLMVTAPAKMRTGERVMLSFASTIQETIKFQRNPRIVQHNFEAAEQFVRGIEERARHATRWETNYVWQDVPAADVLSFLDALITHPDARKARSDLLAKYIRTRVAGGELLRWTVAVLSSGAGREQEVAGLRVGLIKRSSFEAAQGAGDYAIRRLVSPRDEAIDLTEEQVEEALDSTRYDWEAHRDRSRRKTPPDIPGGPQIRDMRPKENGLILIYPLDPASATPPLQQVPVVGIALSFPSSGNATGIEYIVNNVFWEQEFATE